MSREWRRAPDYTRCGLCNAEIPMHAPALFVKLENVKRERIRCASCVGEAPPDLPAVIETHRSTKAMRPLKNLAKDWTQERRDLR